jgi:hypothetical protein
MVAFKPLVVSAAVLATPISAIFTDHVSLVARQAVGGLLGGLSTLVAPSPLLGPLLAGTPVATPAAVKPASAPVYPAPAAAPAPVPVRPAPAPVPAAAPAPVYAPAPAQGLQISASIQIVATIQFFSTRSASISQLASALVTADVSLYAQGQGNLSPLVNLFTTLANSLSTAVSTLSKAPQPTSPDDINSVFIAYQQFVLTQQATLNNFAGKVTFLRTVTIIPVLIRSSYSDVNALYTQVLRLIPSRAADIQRIGNSYYAVYQSTLFAYTGQRSKREISGPMRFMPREIAASA